MKLKKTMVRDSEAPNRKVLERPYRTEDVKAEPEVVEYSTNAHGDRVERRRLAVDPGGHIVWLRPNHELPNDDSRWRWARPDEAPPQ